MSNEVVEEYRNYFGSSYKIIFTGYAEITGGDYDSIHFRVELDEKLVSNIEIRISNTLIAVWDIKGKSRDKTYVKLGFLRLMSMAEKEEFKDGDYLISFDSFNTDNDWTKVITAEEKHLDYYRERNFNYLDSVKMSYEKNTEMSQSMLRDNLDFQQSHSKEIRSIIIQVVSVSGVIVAAILTLEDMLSQNTLLIISVILFLLAIFIGLFPMLSTLENNMLKINDSFRDYSKIVDETIIVERNFLMAPSLEGYKRVVKVWDKDIKALKARQKEINLVKDKKIIALKTIFFAGMVSLVLSYFDYAGIYNWFNNFLHSLI